MDNHEVYCEQLFSKKKSTIKEAESSASVNNEESLTEMVCLTLKKFLHFNVNRNKN